MRREAENDNLLGDTYGEGFTCSSGKERSLGENVPFSESVSQGDLLWQGQIGGWGLWRHDEVTLQDVSALGRPELGLTFVEMLTLPWS